MLQPFCHCRWPVGLLHFAGVTGWAEPCAVLTCPLPLKWRQLVVVASHCFVDGCNAAYFSRVKVRSKDTHTHTHTPCLDYSLSVYCLSWQPLASGHVGDGQCGRSCVCMTCGMPARSRRVQGCAWAVGGTGHGPHHPMWDQQQLELIWPLQIIFHQSSTSFNLQIDK